MRKKSSEVSLELRAFLKSITKVVADGCVAICDKHTIEIESTEDLNKQFSINTSDRLNQILVNAKKAATQADILENIQNRKVDKLVKDAFIITVLHECVVWSKEIVVGMLSERLKSLDPISYEANELADKIISITSDTDSYNQSLNL